MVLHLTCSLTMYICYMNVYYMNVYYINVYYTHQGAIDYKGTETFAKEHKLKKLLRELKLPPMKYNKKVHWFLSHASNGNFAAF